MLLDTDSFSRLTGVSKRAARKAFKAGRFRDFVLPVVQVPAHRGGAGGKVWALAVDRCPAALKAKLGVFEGPFEPALQSDLNAGIEPWQWEEQADRLRIIAPLLALEKGSAERAGTFRQIAAQVHLVRGVPTRLAETTLRDWVRLHERQGPAGLLPKQRSDKGKARVLVTREWDRSIGLGEIERREIAAKLDEKAAGYVAKKATHRKLIRVCEAQLVELSERAGCALPAGRLRQVCRLNLKWAQRFDKYREVALHDTDHKAFSDRHSARVTRAMEAVPMDVIMGDVHHVDMWIAPLSEPITVKIIAWMDAASGYLWATPVLVNNRQGITQSDVAQSLAQVVFCPWGGMPTTFILDNGSEYKWLYDVVGRLAYLSQGNPAFRMIKCRPYSPESKGRLEGSFQIFKGIIKGLPGYIGGDRMKKPTQSKGRPVPPYPHGRERLVEDINRAVEIYNGTPQGGMLGGLSPWAVFKEKAAATGFSPRHPDLEAFDFVFSREVKRDVRNCRIELHGKHYYGDVLAGRDFLGARQIPVMVPLRDPTGPVMILDRQGKIHTLTIETYSLTDGEGARRQAELAKLQSATIRELRSEADLTVSEFDDLHALADKGPIQTNPPEKWSMGPLVKLTDRKTEEELAEEQRAERQRKLLAMIEGATGPEERAISGGNR